MERREKAEFLLEQMRLCLDKQDYVRAELVSNKISKKMMSEAEFQVSFLTFPPLLSFLNNLCEVLCCSFQDLKFVGNLYKFAFSCHPLAI